MKNKKVMKFMKLYIFEIFMKHFSCAVDTNIQMNKLMVSLPHNNISIDSNDENQIFFTY